MILFGLAQQLALCHTVVSGLIAVRPDHFLEFESALTFITCLLGLVFCFPLATEFGIFVVYFLDYIVGSAWWVIVLYLAQLFAVFVVRGKPYSAESIVAPMFPGREGGKGCCAKVLRQALAFLWSVVSERRESCHYQ